MDEQYLSLDAIAARLGLPRNYLRDLAHRGVIPSLNIRGRLRFDESSVRMGLNQLASRDIKIGESRHDK